MARSVGIDRRRIVEVAAIIADSHGFDQLTLAQVAAELGVRLPSLYNHINGLAGLRRELALVGTRQLLEQFSHAAIGKSSDAAIYSIAQAYRSYVIEHPGCYTATIRSPDAADRELQQASQALIDVVLTVLEPYGLDHEAAIHAVRGLRSIIHGFATLEIVGGFGLALDREESFQRLLRAYLVGLRDGVNSRSS